jgi:hypothetical protein
MMLFSSWLRNCKSSLDRRAELRRTGRSKRAGRRLAPRLFLEVLEDRTLLSTYLVTNTGDNGGYNPAPGAGTGTLRQALVDANYYNTGTADNPDQIQFALNPNTDPGYNSTSKQFTIQPLSYLPTITDTVNINDFSQSGSSMNMLPGMGSGAGDNAFQNIILDGSKISSQVDGLAVAAGGSTVQGLQIQNFTNDIHLTTNGNDVIAGNYLANANNYGIFVDNVPNNTIGGTTPGARNVLGYNAEGIGIQGAGATGNQVQGDYIGIGGPDGSQLLIQGTGVFIYSASNNVVGGTAAGAGNVIAGAGLRGGIYIAGNHDASGNLVQGNYIGLDATGTAVIPGLGYIGVLLGQVDNTIIGGTTPSARNIISGWQSEQVALNGSGGMPPGSGNVVEGNYIGTNAAGSAGFVSNPASSFTLGIYGWNNTVISDNLISGLGEAIQAEDGDRIQGNKIGTDATGTQPLPNGFGIWAVSSALIGGTTPGAGNTIAFNDGPAVEVGGHGLASEGNSIYGNAGPYPAIDNLEQYFGAANLSPTLPEANSPGGPFTGTNNATISGLTLTQTGSTLTYSGTLINGQPYTRYLVTLAANSSDGTNWGSDYTYLTTDRNGVANFTDSSAISFPAPWPSSYTPGNPSATANPPHSLGNYEQNYPVLTSASSSASDTSVTGTLNGQANTTFRIEFFSNPAADPSGYGQGQTYLGFANFTTDASGNVTFTTDLATGNLAGQWIAATATDPNGNTSQFSTDVQVTAAPSQTYAQYLQAVLPQSSTGNSMTIQASASIMPATVIAAVNSLTNVTQPVTVILDLGGGTYSTDGVVADPPPNVTFVVQNGTLDPNYPALTVAGGHVLVSNCTLTTTGNAPTLLVTGGSVTLLNDDIIQASTVYTDPAISLTGGTVNLGTTTAPGNNILSVNRSGDLVSNTSGHAISAVGDTFEVGGSVETAPSLSFTALTSGAATTTLNQAVTLTATVEANGSTGRPTGSVDFFDTTTDTDLGSVLLSGGFANLTTSILAPGNHVIVAQYGGDANFLPSADTYTESVHYNFSGFLPPLSNSLAFAVNRTIPIKFQLSDANGNPITSLSAVTSLQIQAQDAHGNPVGAPFNPTASGGTSLSNSGGQYQFNWQTKGLAAGSYEIVLTLADGTTHTKTIQLTSGGSSAGLVTGSSGGTATAGALLGGEVDLFVDNSNGDLTSDELARIQDAVNAVDATIAPYGVTIIAVSDPTQANVSLNMAATSALGGVAQGVLGCTTDADQVTMIQGWNWYAGSDPTQVGAGQYDFETAVMHELGHVLGLGHSSTATSVMYSTLASGSTDRTLTTADLSVPDTHPGPDALHAAVTAPVSVPSRGPGMTPVGGVILSGSSDPSSAMDQLFSSADLARLLSGMLHAYQAELSSLLGLWQRADALFVQRFDALLSMGMGSRMLGMPNNARSGDLMFAS